MFSLLGGNQIFDLASKVGVLDKLLPAGTSLRNALIAKLLLVGLVSQYPEVIRLMRRMKLDNIKRESSLSPDIDSLIGMLKPFVVGKKWRSDIRGTISFMKGFSCQMHSTVHSILLSQFWHLSHLLKVFIVLKSIDLIVVP